MKKIEVFYKEEKCYLKNKEWIDIIYKEKNNLHIKDYFDNNLEITEAEKIIIDKINELIDELNNIMPTNAKATINYVYKEQKGLKWK